MSDSFILDPRSRDMFVEFLSVIAIISILMMLAVPNFNLISTKIRLTEALTLMTSYRTDVAVYRAQTGRMPDSDEFDREEGDRVGRFVLSPVWQDEEIVFRLSEPTAAEIGQSESNDAPATTEHTLGFRVSVNPNTGSMAWICGTRQPPRGFESPESRHTTIPDAFLPHPCRLPSSP